jgi:hypothetical protein
LALIFKQKQKKHKNKEGKAEKGQKIARVEKEMD